MGVKLRLSRRSKNIHFTAFKNKLLTAIFGINGQAGSSKRCGKINNEDLQNTYFPSYINTVNK
jgi:hypothetical protein